MLQFRAGSQVQGAKVKSSEHEGELKCREVKTSVPGPFLSGFRAQICYLVCDLEEIINLIHIKRVNPCKVRSYYNKWVEAVVVISSAKS